jgi:hypothetical protein
MRRQHAPPANRPVTTPRQQPAEAKAIAIANTALLGQQLATTTAGSKRTIAAAKNITMTTIAIASVMNSRLMAAPGAALFEFSLSLGARVCRGVRDHVVAAAARRIAGSARIAGVRRYFRPRNRYHEV